MIVMPDAIESDLSPSAQQKSTDSIAVYACGQVVCVVTDLCDY